MRPLPTGILLTLLSLGIHLAPMLNSQLSMSSDHWNTEENIISEEYLAYNIEVHRSMEPAFIKRPLTTRIIDGLVWAGISPGWAFALSGSLLFLIAGLLVRRRALALGLSLRECWLEQMVFHLLPTVLFAFFAPMYTYDEPLQYVFLVLALGAFAQQRHALFIVCFSCALLARETSVLLLPSLLWLASAAQRNAEAERRGKRLLRLAVLATPLLVYVAFLWFYLPHAGIVDSSHADLSGRFAFFDENFKDGDMSGETLCFAFLALGLPVFLIARYALSPMCTDDHKRWIKAFVIAVVLNTAVVLVATKAREARLFALPLLLVLPLLGRAWSVEVGRHGGLVGLLGFFKRWHYALVFFFFGGIVVLVSDHIFSLSDGVGSENLFHEYFVVQSLFMGCCLLADVHRRQELSR